MVCSASWSMVYRKGPGVKKSGPKGPRKIKGQVLEALLEEMERHPSEPSHVIARRVTERTHVQVASRTVRKVVDLSVDQTHILDGGEKAVKRWGSPFTTMMNRALPGLYPLTCLDLLSGLFLLASDFIGKARKDRKGRTKDLGKVTAKKILGCVDFLMAVGVKVRSVTGDEGMCSDHLIEELGKRG